MPRETGASAVQGYPRITHRRLLRGCNTYHGSSVLRLEVALGPLEGMTTADLGQGFSSEFLTAFEPAGSPLSGWAVSACFLERLASPEGAPVEEALLEAVLALDNRVLARMFYLDRIAFAAAERSPGGTLVLVRQVHDPEMARAVAETAIAGFAEIAGSAAPARLSFRDTLRDLLDRASRRRLAGSTSILKSAALRKGVPFETMSGQHLVVGQGARQQHLYSSLTGTTSFSAAKLSLDKRQCNRRLAGLSLPVPQQIGVGDAEAAVAALATLGAPVVVKPSKGNQGRGVTVGVRDADEMRAAFETALAEESGVLVEEWVEGADHRLVVIGGRLIAAITSRPAEVTGDGRRSVRELVAELNAEEDRDDVRLSPVALDSPLDRHLAAQGLTLDGVPEPGRVVSLGAHGHVAAGGVPHDVTDLIHPDNRQIAERAAAAVGLDVAGVDIVSPDISRSHREVGGKILEVNTRPGLVMHAWPRSGRPRDVAGAIIDLIYAAPDEAFVPTLVITGDRATSAAGHQAAKLLGANGTRVGLALKDRAFIDGVPVDIRRSRIGRAASILLRDPAIEALVAALSLRRAATHGLGLQTCDGVAVLQEDGSDAAAVRAGLDVFVRANRGSFLLAATDRLAREALAGMASERIVLVSEDPYSPDVATHLAAGGKAVLRHWTTHGPKMRFEQQGGVLAEAPLESRARVRVRTIEASMFAFGLVMAFGRARVDPVHAGMQTPL